MTRCEQPMPAYCNAPTTTTWRIFRGGMAAWHVRLPQHRTPLLRAEQPSGLRTEARTDLAERPPSPPTALSFFPWRRQHERNSFDVSVGLFQVVMKPVVFGLQVKRVCLRLRDSLPVGRDKRLKAFDLRLCRNQSDFRRQVPVFTLPQSLTRLHPDDLRLHQRPYPLRHRLDPGLFECRPSPCVPGLWQSARQHLPSHLVTLP